MFGYITPKKCELRVHEYETYKAYYCGLCKALQHGYSIFSSAAVSYDCAFLYLLHDSLLSGKNELVRCKCILHPVEHRMEVKAPCAGYPAAVNVLLTYYKIKDDIQDGKRQSAAAAPFIYPAYRKAGRLYPDTEEAIRAMHRSLMKIQDSGSKSIDETAGAFAVLLGKVFENLDPEEWENLYDLGYNLGRWLYIIDALDDIGKDQKSGNYNVFLSKYGDSGDPALRKEAEFNLYFSLAKAAEAYTRLRVKKNRGILDNILYLGLKERTNMVIKGESV
jgi:hypothetical protein